MKIKLEPTSKKENLRPKYCFQCDPDGESILIHTPTRIWLGETESGIKLRVYIASIECADENTPEIIEQFRKELEKHLSEKEDNK